MIGRLVVMGVSPDRILAEIQGAEDDGYYYNGGGGNKHYENEHFDLLRRVVKEYTVKTHNAQRRLLTSMIGDSKFKGSKDMDLSAPTDIMEMVATRMDRRKASSKKTKKKRKKKKKKPSKKAKTKALTGTLTPEMYQELIDRRKSKKHMTKKQKKQLDNELFVNYCRCIKKLKYEKKDPKGREYPYCASSVFKNRGFDVPKGITKKCRT